MNQQPRYDLWIMSSLRRIMRAVDVHSRKLMAEYQITGPQLLCLQALQEDGPLTATALSKLVHLAVSTVVGILDRLEAKGWIVRERSTQDRRVVLVYISEEGRNLVNQAPLTLQNRLAGRLVKMPVKEQGLLAQAVETIVELLEVEDFGAAPILEWQPIETSLAEPAASKDMNIESIGPKSGS